MHFYWRLNSNNNYHIFCACWVRIAVQYDENMGLSYFELPPPHLTHFRLVIVRARAVGYVRYFRAWTRVTHSLQLKHAKDVGRKEEEKKTTHKRIQGCSSSASKKRLLFGRHLHPRKYVNKSCFSPKSLFFECIFISCPTSCCHCLLSLSLLLWIETNNKSSQHERETSNRATTCSGSRYCAATRRKGLVFDVFD